VRPTLLMVVLALALSLALVSCDKLEVATTTSTAVATSTTVAAVTTTTPTGGSTEKELKVRVPDLVGMQYEDAEAELEDCDLECEIVKVPVLPPPWENVVAQDPAAESWVSRHSTVTIEVIFPGVTVPNVVGLAEEEAYVRIAVAELDPEIRYAVTADPTEVGRVIEQDPSSGYALPLAKVWLTVGVPIPDFSTPDLNEIIGPRVSVPPLEH
jgi:beta-lactam-binding protein with PASTA domain